MARRILLPSLLGVVAGSTAVLNIPKGPTYEKINLVVSGSGGVPLTIALMKNLQLKLNGQVVQEYATGQELQDINDYYNRPKTDGVLTFFFRRPELDNNIQRLAPGLGTADLSDISIQFDVDATVTGATVTASARVSAPQPLGIFTKVKRFPRNFGAGGDQEIDTIPKGPNIFAMHVWKDADDITNAAVDLNSVRIHEATAALEEADAKEFGRAPVAKYRHIDFNLNDDLGESLATNKNDDFRTKLTMTTGGQVVVLVEYLDGFAGL